MGTFYAAYGYDSNHSMVLLMAMFCVHNESTKAWKMFCVQLVKVYGFEDDQEGSEPHPHRIDSPGKVMLTDGHAAIAVMFEGGDAVFLAMLQSLCE